MLLSWNGSNGQCSSPSCDVLVNVQRGEQRLQRLPDDLWAKVLDYLSATELLDARRVSKCFIRLSQHPELAFDWRTRHEEEESSLTLFVFRHLRQPNSPHLSLRLDSRDERFAHLQMVLACSCANLRRLDICDTVNTSQAKTLLCSLPVVMLLLDINLPAAVLTDPGWSRLIALTFLQLWIQPSRPSVSVNPSIFAAMVSLKHLAFGWRPEYDDHPRCFFDRSFSHSGITSLRMDHDPFGGLDLAQLPCLQPIHLSKNLPVPKWLLHQPFSVLVVESSQQFEMVDTRKLLCSGLRVICCSDQSWKLEQLLLMPALNELQIGPLGLQTHVKLAGSLKGHAQRIRARFLVPVQLDIPNPACSTTIAVQLKRSGHAFACVCPSCSHQA